MYHSMDNPDLESKIKLLMLDTTDSEVELSVLEDGDYVLSKNTIKNLEIPAHNIIKMSNNFCLVWSFSATRKIKICSINDLNILCEK